MCSWHEASNSTESTSISSRSIIALKWCFSEVAKRLFCTWLCKLVAFSRIEISLPSSPCRAKVHFLQIISAGPLARVIKLDMGCRKTVLCTVRTLIYVCLPKFYFLFVLNLISPESIFLFKKVTFPQISVWQSNGNRSGARKKSKIIIFFSFVFF